MKPIHITLLYVALLIGILLSVSCADDQLAVVTPAGAAKEQNTFLLFFTDN